MKHKAFATALFLTITLLLSSELFCSASDPVPPFIFTKEGAAFTNGQAVLAALKIGDAQSKSQVQALFESRVLFDYSYSKAGEVVVGDNISLEVEVSSPFDFWSPVHAYKGECVGILKAVDFEKHVIRIKSLASGPFSPLHFTKEGVAFTNGLLVLSALKIGDTQSKSQVQALIGSRVWFHFVSGDKPDMEVVGDNIFLAIEVSPPRELPRGDHAYSGEVVGTLKAVDFEKHVIHIKIRPEGWSLGVIY
jgi:hypothetical protein